MKITNPSGKYPSSASAVNRPQKNLKPIQESDQPVGEQNELTVSLSKTSRAIQIARKALSETPDMRTDKVEKIKQALSEGSYKIDAERTAQKIVDGLRPKNRP